MPIFNTSDFFPLISAILVLLFSLAVYKKNRKNDLNSIFIFFSISIVIWLFGTFMLFISEFSTQQIFWDRFIYLGVVFIPTLVYHFSIAYTKLNNQSKLLPFSYFGAFTFLIMSRTDYFVKDLFYYPWGVHTQAQIWHHIFLLWFTIHTLGMLRNLHLHYKKSKQKNKNIANQTKLVYLAFIILFTIGPLAFLPAYNISIYPFPFLSGFFFVLVLSFAIYKHQLFDIRIVAKEIVFYTTLLTITTAAAIAAPSNLLTYKILLFLLVVFASWDIVNKINRKELEHLELEKVHKANMNFISDVAHRLKGPLIIAQTKIRTAKNKNKLIKKDIQDIENIINATYRTVHNIVQNTKIDSKLAKIQPRNTNIKKLIRSWSGEIKSLAPSHKIVFSLEDNCYTEIDTNYFFEALINLVDNAQKFSPENSKISIEAKKIENQVKITIADEGCGISKSANKKIFDTYFQDKKTKNIAGSAGLGLPLVKWIIEQHGGGIEAKNNSIGTSFVITLPAAAQPPKLKRKITKATSS